MMENRPKISTFRVVFKKKQIEPSSTYLQISKVNLSSLTNPDESYGENKKNGARQKESEVIENKGSIVKLMNDKIVVKSLRNSRIKNQPKVKSLSSDNKNRLELKNMTRDLLQGMKGDTTDSPIHSRKCQRFRILSNTLRKQRSHTCETMENTGLHGDVMKIKRETIHDFNDYSIKYIQSLQKQAARVIKTAERQAQRNQINYKTSQARRKIKLEENQREDKRELFRPWSRQKDGDFREEESSPIPSR